MTHATPQRAGMRQWAGLGLLALPTVLLGLDVTVLYLALPSITADLAPSATQTLWIVDAYGFLIAGFLITMGTLGDRVGRRRLLVIGIGAFAAVSVVAAVAPSAEVLIAARGLLGIAGATLMPSTLSLISNMFPDARQRAVAVGLWATAFAFGMAAGPVVGGALVDRFWWGAAFLLAVPVALVVMGTARAVLPEYSDPAAEKLDLYSVVLSLSAILPGVYAVKDVAAYGPAPQTAALLFGGLVAGVLFVRRQRRIPTPLLDVGLFADRTFSAALAVLLVGLIGVGGTMYLVTQYLQLVDGLSPAHAGLWMGPAAFAMFAAAIGAPLLARVVRPGVIMAATLAISLSGYAVLATAGVGDTGWVVAGFAFIYLGLGAIAALGTDMVVGAAPASRSGSAAAMSETVQEFGLAAGVALLGSLATAVYRSQQVPGSDDTGEALTAGVNAAALVAGLAILGAIVLALWALRHVGTLGETQHVDSGQHHPADYAEAQERAWSTTTHSTDARPGDKSAAPRSSKPPLPLCSATAQPASATAPSQSKPESPPA